MTTLTAVQMLEKSFERFAAKDMRGWCDLCAPDVVAEFPFEPEGLHLVRGHRPDIAFDLIDTGDADGQRPQSGQDQKPQGEVDRRWILQRCIDGWHLLPRHARDRRHLVRPCSRQRLGLRDRLQVDIAFRRGGRLQDDPEPGVGFRRRRSLGVPDRLQHVPDVACGDLHTGHATELRKDMRHQRTEPPSRDAIASQAGLAALEGIAGHIPKDVPVPDRLDPAPPARPDRIGVLRNEAAILHGALPRLLQRQGGQTAEAHLAPTVVTGVAEDPLPASVRSLDQPQPGVIPMLAGREVLDRDGRELAP